MKPEGGRSLRALKRVLKIPLNLILSLRQPRVKTTQVYFVVLRVNIVLRIRLLWDCIQWAMECLFARHLIRDWPVLIRTLCSRRIHLLHFQMANN